MKLYIKYKDEKETLDFDKELVVCDGDSIFDFKNEIEDNKNEKYYSYSYYCNHINVDYDSNSFYVMSNVVYPIKPKLHYIEFHINDTCCLNCKGCSHFSPLFKNNNDLNLDNIKKDFCLLSRIYRNIEVIRIMGGEPLLCTNYLEFALMIRKVFPFSNVFIVSNGMLNIPDNCIDVFLKENIKIVISNYGISDFKLNEKQKKVFIITKKIESFSKFFSEKQTNRHVNFDKCMIKNCVFYRNSRLYHCAIEALIYKYNDTFMTGFPIVEGINLKDNTSSDDIIKFLNQPSEMCSYCNNCEIFKWERVGKKAKKEDWV